MSRNTQTAEFEKKSEDDEISTPTIAPNGVPKNPRTTSYGSGLVPRTNTQLTGMSTKASRKLGYAEQNHPRKLYEKCSIDVHSVFDEAERYKKVQYGNIAMTNLPVYDDITAYGTPKDFPPETQVELWHDEIRRLVDNISHGEGTSTALFNSGGTLKSISALEREQLHKVADQISCNLALLYHDNLNLDPSLLEKPDSITTRFAISSKNILRRRLDPDSQQDPDDILSPRPPEILEEKNEEIYHLIVDHVTALLAVVLCRSVFSQQWQNQVIATLAKYSTKLKIAMKDPASFAAASLATAEEMREAADQNNYLNVIEGRFPSLNLEKEYNPADLYHYRERSFRDIIHILLVHILDVAFQVQQPYKNIRHRKELCSKVYRNGRDNLHTIISNDAEGNFAVTSDGTQLRIYRTAIDILLRRCKLIQDRSGLLSKPLPSEPSEKLSVDWKWLLNPEHKDAAGRPEDLTHGEEGHLKVSQMDDAVSMLVCFALCDPHATTEMSLLISIGKRLYSRDDHVVHDYYDEDFMSELSLSTSTIAAKDPQPSQKSGALMSTSARNIYDLKDAENLRDRVLPGVNLLVPPDDPSKQKEEFDRQMARMQDWQIDENSIVVRCRWFAWPILGIAALFVIGGAIIPFTGRVKLSGVDPSNLSTYIWLAVAFVLLIIQSVYVPHWTWHDFLRARVRCHSLSDLASVTVMDPQIILYKLLVDERLHILNTRGPYNSMFARKSDGGFAIDCASLTSTLYASGFVLFICLCATGQQLICQDARPGRELTHLAHTAAPNQDRESLGCDLPDESLPSLVTRNLPPLQLKFDQRERFYVRGLYLREQEFA